MNPLRIYGFVNLNLLSVSSHGSKRVNLKTGWKVAIIATASFSILTRIEAGEPGGTLSVQHRWPHLSVSSHGSKRVNLNLHAFRFYLLRAFSILTRIEAGEPPLFPPLYRISELCQAHFPHSEVFFKVQGRMASHLAGDGFATRFLRQNRPGLRKRADNKKLAATGKPYRYMTSLQKRRNSQTSHLAR